MLSRKEFRYLRLYNEAGEKLNNLYDEEQKLYFKNPVEYEKRKDELYEKIEKQRRRFRYLDRCLTIAHEEAQKGEEK